jgi:UDP-N-acetylglucosamine:LPS N-acetylglucosamine transferase
MIYENEKISVTFILSIGGHTFETLSLIDKLEWFVKPSYLICDDNSIAFSNIRVKGPVKMIKSSFFRLRDKGFFYCLPSILKGTVAFIQSLNAFKQFKSEAFISLGSGTSFVPMIAAKLTGKKIIYIESACRVHSRSLFGSFAYKFLVDLFLVQWEDLLEIYPKAIYAGRPF